MYIYIYIYVYIHVLQYTHMHKCTYLQIWGCWASCEHEDHQSLHASIAAKCSMGIGMRQHLRFDSKLALEAVWVQNCHCKGFRAGVLIGDGMLQLFCFFVEAASLRESCSAQVY